MTNSVQAARPLPLLNELNTFFWTSGADGRLRMQRCADCGHWQHPAGVICTRCASRNVAPQVLSGKATIQAMTLNHQPWIPGVEVPYVIAIVELDEQPGLHLTTNIVGTPPESVTIGQRVRVTFEAHEDVFLPLFTPDDLPPPPAA
jgi:uncharacterized OB-fold protein